LTSAQAKGEQVDYLTFVPDGEPTLDVNLGELTCLLKPLGVKIAVITNSSFFWHKDVCQDLSEADWVSMKIDAANEESWRRINKPHPLLSFDAIRDGILVFAEKFHGELTTETMLVKNVNDTTEHARELAGLLARIQPGTAYVTIPTRPPTEQEVAPPEEKQFNKACQVISGCGCRVVCLKEEEEGLFTSTGDVVQDLLSITAVHPMEEASVRRYLQARNANWKVVEVLLTKGELVELHYSGKRFFRKKQP
jgi:wyosine [tRNA(Phe)-imidazoG37] synthetase (radical SAM superfamily)